MACVNNNNIVCNGGNCETCGWNPAVSAERIKRIKAGSKDVLKVDVRGAEDGNSD